MSHNEFNAYKINAEKANKLGDQPLGKTEAYICPECHQKRKADGKKAKYYKTYQYLCFHINKHDSSQNTTKKIKTNDENLNVITNIETENNQFDRKSKNVSDEETEIDEKVGSKTKQS